MKQKSKNTEDKWPINTWVKKRIDDLIIAESEALNDISYSSLDDSDFKQTALFKAALIQIRNEISKYFWLPPMLVLEKFRDTMNDYSLSSKNSYNYSVAYDAAEYVIDDILGA